MKKQLLEKYWKGETSPEEESWLKRHVPSFKNEVAKEEATYLEQLGQFSELSLEKEFDLSLFEGEGSEKAKVLPFSFYRNFRKIAAAVLILVTFSVATYTLTKETTKIAAVEENLPVSSAEATEAFEIAKQSLMLISANLNKGVTYTKELNKFNLTQEKIKSETLKNN